MHDIYAPKVAAIEYTTQRKFNKHVDVRDVMVVKAVASFYVLVKELLFELLQIFKSCNEGTVLQSLKVDRNNNHEMNYRVPWRNLLLF